jgi:Recombination endonuclease VII
MMIVLSAVKIWRVSSVYGAKNAQWPIQIATTIGAKSVLHVDHDHATGAVRGLLCSDCNTALGHLHDSPEIIHSLLKYVLQDIEEK